MQRPRHIKPANRPCTHATYVLTCDEYEELLDFTGNRCQVCDVAPEETVKGVLSIDHDGMLGQWAVRGLLCQPCNARIEWPHLRSEAADRYLARPWYRLLLDRAGVAGTSIPEPPLGSWVTAGGWIHYRTERGWHTTWAYKWPKPPIDWRTLCYRRGPHHIQYGESQWLPPSQSAA